MEASRIVPGMWVQANCETAAIHIKVSRGTDILVLGRVQYYGSWGDRFPGRTADGREGLFIPAHVKKPKED